jgi:DHA1 family solute carrier family 18 vesicular amine transporter 1/2
MIIVIVTAIWISTSAMAILEPCLPLWLLTQLRPEKWQLGTVFIPDSIGYLIGTNFFGMFAFRVGQIRTSFGALLIVGIACIVIPEVRTVSSLIIPHFGLGLGIGIIDASLVPMLASIVDSKMMDNITFSSIRIIYLYH